MRSCFYGIQVSTFSSTLHGTKQCKDVLSGVGEWHHNPAARFQAETANPVSIYPEGFPARWTTCIRGRLRLADHIPLQPTDFARTSR